MPVWTVTSFSTPSPDMEHRADHQQITAAPTSSSPSATARRFSVTIHMRGSSPDTEVFAAEHSRIGRSPVQRRRLLRTVLVRYRPRGARSTSTSFWKRTLHSESRQHYGYHSPDMLRAWRFNIGAQHQFLVIAPLCPMMWIQDSAPRPQQ